MPVLKKSLSSEIPCQALFMFRKNTLPSRRRESGFGSQQDV